MEKCLICGRNINLAKSNWVHTDDGYKHKKCPKVVNKMSDIEKQQYESLRNTINVQYTTRPSDYYREHYLNWKAVTNQIKQLHTKGYTYEEIEYATIEVFKEFGAFLGFGGVVNRIDGIIAKRNKRNEDIAKINNEFIIDNSDKGVLFDLNDIINESEDW